MKPPKRVLNNLALKFKINKLWSPTIRYEVIYKNLLRDVRKFYTHDFKVRTTYLEERRRVEKDKRDLYLVEAAALYLRVLFDQTVL